jgi:hypothetical protein
VLELWMPAASPPGVVLPVSSALDLLQGAHRSAHFDHSVSYTLR